MIEGDLIHIGLKTVAMLLVVLGLLALALYAMKKSFFIGEKSKGELCMKVVSSLHLSPKERIAVVDISGEKIVLGITSNNICLLTKLTGSDDTREHTSG